MNFTIRIIDAHKSVEELIPADTIQVFQANHKEPRVPPEGGILYTFNGKEELIIDGLIYVMNSLGKTVAKYRF